MFFLLDSPLKKRVGRRAGQMGPGGWGSLYYCSRGGGGWVLVSRRRVFGLAALWGGF